MAAPDDDADAPCELLGPLLEWPDLLGLVLAQLGPCTTARGAKGRAQTPPRAGTWRCCSGRERTAARGLKGRLHRRF